MGPASDKKLQILTKKLGKLNHLLSIGFEIFYIELNKYKEKRDLCIQGIISSFS